MSESEEGRIETEIREYQMWVNHFTSSLTHNPWDAYLEQKVKSINEFRERIERLKNEL